MSIKRYRLFFIVLILLLGAGMTAHAQQDQAQAEPIVYESHWPELPYVSHWVEVNGSKIHYFDVGDPSKDPILLLHGQPTWSYLWRNVIPYLTTYGRVIAMDNIGFGRSDKPDIAYRFEDHIQYLEGFISALDLKNITFVIHDWGSALGFDYASRHEDNVKAIAFMEAMIPPTFPFESYEAMPPGTGDVFTAFRTTGMGEELLMNQNMFIEQFLPMMVMRQLTQDELDAYRAPFPQPEDRYPVWRWPNELPIAGEPADVTAVLAHYFTWLEQTEIPMLHVYAMPGAANPEVSVEWSRTHIKNIDTAFVGEGLHFIQEDHPDEVGQAIADWLSHLNDTNN